uniref:PIN domain-containing protein n=1 Tax=Candidatus Desulfatibia profunda TaxID=2841695 RepID=A0A8J6NQG7_9BACT|nr:PIN domain-containing protein [Candidatus Desulfatibia profunda]
MKNKAFDARSHAFSNSDSMLVDANIWLYLLGPASVSQTWASIYSGVFNRILSAGSLLSLDVLVLSEFINQFARLEMRRLQPGQYDFKAFRGSADFPPVARSIESQVNQILMVCRPVDHPFSEWRLSDLLNDFGTGAMDWNDQLITENCRKHGLALLTNDGDFTKGGISVFTANNRLLAACP